jgi:hypothetical protein
MAALKEVKQGAQGAFAKTICEATIIVEAALGRWLLYFRRPAQLHQNLLGWNFLADSTSMAAVELR